MWNLYNLRNTQALSNLKVNMTIKTFLTQNESANPWIFALVNSTFSTFENIKAQKNVFKLLSTGKETKRYYEKSFWKITKWFSKTLCASSSSSITPAAGFVCVILTLLTL